MDERALLEALEEKGLIEQVVKSLNLGRGSKSSSYLSPRHEKPASSEEESERGGEEERTRLDRSPCSPPHLHHRLSAPDGKYNDIHKLDCRECSKFQTYSNFLCSKEKHKYNIAQYL